MTLLLLDTTFLIDAERSGNLIETAIGDEDDVAVAAITIAELVVGVELAGNAQRRQRQAFVTAVADGLPVLAYDLSIAQAHASLLATVRLQGRPRGAHDLIVAATAKATGRTVLSADLSVFDDLPGVATRDHRS